jgi:hypothetical protein
MNVNISHHRLAAEVTIYAGSAGVSSQRLHKITLKHMINAIDAVPSETSHC